MALARSVYSRELKIAAMRAMDGGESRFQVARRMQLGPRLLERWRAEWREHGESAFPGIGRRQELAPVSEERRSAELERKIGQLTIENDFLKKALAHFREHPPSAVVNGGVACTAKCKKQPKQAGR